jgi:hypothetical protein
VRKVVDVGEYPYGEVDGGDDEQVRHGRNLPRCARRQDIAC